MLHVLLQKSAFLKNRRVNINNDSTSQVTRNALQPINQHLDNTQTRLTTFYLRVLLKKVSGIKSYSEVQVTQVDVTDYYPNLITRNAKCNQANPKAIANFL